MVARRWPSLKPASWRWHHFLTAGVVREMTCAIDAPLSAWPWILQGFLHDYSSHLNSCQMYQQVGCHSWCVVSSFSTWVQVLLVFSQNTDSVLYMLCSSFIVQTLMSWPDFPSVLKFYLGVVQLGWGLSGKIWNCEVRKRDSRRSAFSVWGCQITAQFWRNTFP